MEWLFPGVYYLIRGLLTRNWSWLLELQTILPRIPEDGLRLSRHLMLSEELANFRNTKEGLLMTPLFPHLQKRDVSCTWKNRLMVLGKHQLICFVPQNHGMLKTNPPFHLPNYIFTTKNPNLSKNIINLLVIEKFTYQIGQLVIFHSILVLFFFLISMPCEIFKFRERGDFSIVYVC